MSENLKFEQIRKIVEEGYAASFNVGLAYPVNIHIADTRQDIVNNLLAAHAPTLELRDSESKYHILIVGKKAAYVRGEPTNYQIAENGKISVNLHDGTKHEVDTNQAVVSLGGIIGVAGSSLPRCRNEKAVKAAANELLADKEFLELSQNKFKSAESEEKYSQRLAEVCEKHGIGPEIKEREGKILPPAEQQDRDITYVVRLVNVTRKLEEKMSGIKQEYELQKADREKPQEAYNGLKEAVSGLSGLNLKEANNAHLMNNQPPIFAHLENNNLVALM
jgi:hypothetical protein